MSETQHDKELSALRITPVVTSFLLRLDDPEPRLCLVRRSQRVGSYHALWAGISGFLEQGVTPEEQAYTEIREETGLPKQLVRLLKRWGIVEHVDEALRRRWLIHPFLVEVLAPDAITLDWEAEELQWITPSELPNYATVPKLYEAFLAAEQGKALSK
ncbi:MAG: NUDIX domain-containing protein, partial [Ktedonobacteraceae bacterium]